jgi:hypothetical protein
MHVAPERLAVISALVGALVRVARSKRIGDWLDRLPPAWIKAIPRSWLPFLALALGVVLSAADARLNGGARTWYDAAMVALEGVIAGSVAVAGHETIGKALGGRPAAPVEKDPAPPEGPAKGGGS